MWARVTFRRAARSPFAHAITTWAAIPAPPSAIGHFAEFDLLGNLVPDATPHDTAEHGSHTAGTIAGRK